MDFLNFAVGLHRELGIDVPEADYAQLRSIEACVLYLTPRSRPGRARSSRPLARAKGAGHKPACHPSHVFVGATKR
jgi:hypothetical protein